MVVPFSGGSKTLGGSGGASNPKVPLFRHICGSLEGTRHWPISSASVQRCSLGYPRHLGLDFEYVTDWPFRRLLSVDFLRFLDVSKSWRNSGALDIQNFDPKFCMKVPIYLTQFNKNKKNSMLTILRAMAVRVSGHWGGQNISHPFAAWRVDNFHAMSFGNC